MIISRETIRKRAQADAARAAHRSEVDSAIAAAPLTYPDNPDAQTEYAGAYAEKLAEYGVLAEA